MKKNIWMSLAVVTAMTMMTACSSDSDSDNDNGFGASHDPAFITTWQISTSGETLDLNASTNTNGTFTVDCGNNTDLRSYKSSDSLPECHYDKPGSYQIKITGDLRQVYYKGESSLISIDNWGDIEWETMRGAFANCEKMEYTATDRPDLSKVEDMSFMFDGAKLFNGDIGSWDTSEVKYMQGTFMITEKFNGDIGDWDTSSVTNMSSMFNAAHAFDQDIGDWNTSKVTSMNQMFYGVHVFDQNISKWDTSIVTDMGEMFRMAKLFDQNISDWNVSAVIDHSSFDTEASDTWTADEKPKF